MAGLCEVASYANSFALQFETGPRRQYAVKKLPFGSNKVSVQREPGLRLSAPLSKSARRFPAASEKFENRSLRPTHGGLDSLL